MAWRNKVKDRDFSGQFEDLIDESVPMVMLKSVEDRSGCIEKKINDFNSRNPAENGFVVNYCEEY